MRSVLLIVAVLFATGLHCAIEAQQEQPSSSESSTRTEPKPIGSLLLEVSYNPNIPPAFISVAGADARPHWVWVTKFLRTPESRQLNETDPIRAVRFEAQFNGETVEVKVTLLRGVTFFDREEEVGKYHLAVGESRVVEALKDFGVVPAEISLLNRRLDAPSPPTIINSTLSVEVSEIKLVSDPLPGYSIILKNLSSKNIDALKIEVERSGLSGPTTALLQGQEGLPLIAAGGTYLWHEQVIKPEQTQGGYEPVSSNINTLFIKSAVFHDFSSEGDPGPACLFESFQVGRKSWLQKIIPVIEEQLSRDNEAIDAQEKFLNRVQRITFAPEAEESNGLLEKSGCNRKANRGELSFRGSQLEFLREFKVFTSTRPRGAPNFQTWLSTHQAKYSDWLKRL